MTIWKPIKGYEGYYEINEHGQVRSLERYSKNRWGGNNLIPSKILKPTFRPQYKKYVYGLTDGSGKLKQHYLHILVAETFNREVPFKNLNNEIWRSIANSKYEVSNKGRIRSIDRVYNSNNNTFTDGRIIRPNQNGHGYLFVNGNNRRLGYVHRLVAKAFLGDAKNSNKLEVNHKNGNKSDNSVENLEWITPKDNKLHAQVTGLLKTGTDSPSGKLSYDDVKAIWIFHKNGKKTRYIMDVFKCNRHVVLDILALKTYKKESRKILKELENE